MLMSFIVKGFGIFFHLSSDLMTICIHFELVLFEDGPELVSSLTPPLLQYHPKLEAIPHVS